MTGIAEWLASIGLGEYAERFRENAIDPSVVRDLTEQDLKDLGVLLGHRRKMLRAIAELQGEPSRTLQTAAKPASGDNAGRRQLTVMFCDLVGSSALSARLDLEDLRTVMGAYHGCVAEVVAKNDGVIARYMGDGVLAYFGYPQAHEDDAEQATRAGLALVDAVAKLRTDPATELKVRVGIATGTVVVGDLTGEGSAQEQTVIGETPNLAARLQTFANPGTVLISESTHRPQMGISNAGISALSRSKDGRSQYQPGRSWERPKWKAVSRRSTRPDWRRQLDVTRKSRCCCAAGSTPGVAKVAR